MIGKPRKAVRRSPPQFVNKNEHERLVNMAARLIAATVSRQSWTIQCHVTSGNFHGNALSDPEATNPPCYKLELPHGT